MERCAHFVRYGGPADILAVTFKSTVEPQIPNSKTCHGAPCSVMVSPSNHASVMTKAIEGRAAEFSDFDEPLSRFRCRRG